MKNTDKKWNLRIKITTGKVSKANRESILPGEFDNEFK